MLIILIDNFILDIYLFLSIIIINMHNKLNLFNLLKLFYFILVDYIYIYIYILLSVEFVQYFPNFIMNFCSLLLDLVIRVGFSSNIARSRTMALAHM